MHTHVKSGIKLITTLIALLLAASCVYLPYPAEPYPQETAPDAAATGILAEIETEIVDAHGPDHSGFHLLDSGVDALTWRLALLDSASSSLDIVYYLWFSDDAGRIMLDRVIAAAERGVKVRLLVDDLILIGKDKGLAALDSYPNIQLRLFNPKRQRAAGMATSALLRFGQLNSRMHNKLIVADNRAVILGGRNIGNSYFGLSEKFNFHDLDVMGFGPVAREGSRLFDNFWNSEWAVSASELPFRLGEDEIRERREALAGRMQESPKLESFPAEPRDWSVPLTDLMGELHVGVGRVIHDRMEGGKIVRGMVDPLGEVLRSAERDIRIVNAYIIPNDAFIAGLERITGEGIDVRILTNSLSSHDLPAVNSHYKKWRKPLIEAGAELYELRSDPDILATRIQTEPVVSQYAGLHSKTVVIDDDRVFIGSFNFDPRSADINTEMGVVIDSPGIAAELAGIFERDTAPENAWHVRLDDEGELLWINSDETVARQPARSGWQRVQDAIFVILPVSQF